MKTILITKEHYEKARSLQTDPGFYSCRTCLLAVAFSEAFQTPIFVGIDKYSRDGEFNYPTKTKPLSKQAQDLMYLFDSNNKELLSLLPTILIEEELTF